MRKASARSARIALIILSGVSLAAGAIGISRGLELPRGFVENRGQWPEEAAWAVQGFYGSSWVLRDGSLRHVFLDHSGCEGGRDRETQRGCQARDWVVGERLRGSLAPVLSADGAPLPLKVSYFVGRDERRHVRDLPAYERLSLGEVYPGIRLKLLAHARSLEKLFELAPGADAGRIEIELQGVHGLRVAQDGALLLATGYGEVRLSPPLAWQEGASGREPVAVAYRLIGDAGYGFALGDYDRSRPLLIDPLIQASYGGGSSGDQFWALDFDPASGDVFVGGETASADFPQVAGGADATIGGSTEGVILRIRPSLDNQPWGGFVQATFFGGSNSDVVRALRVANGYVYAAGYTLSNDLPSATGALGGFQGGAADGFVVRLDLSLTSGLIASYYGGSADDRAYAIEVGGGAVLIAGVSSSSNLPSTAGAAFNSLNGSGPDGFIARFSSDLSIIQRSTYYGGSAFDEIRGIAHVQGAPAYIGAVGATNSNDLPTTAGAHKPTHPGVGDSGEGFAVLFFDDLTAQQAGSYLGGWSNTLADRANAIAYDPVNNRFVIGGEASNGFNDTTAGVVQQSFSGGAWPDGFVVRMTQDFSTLVAGTFLGGTFADVVRAVAIYPGSAEVIAFGSTDSTNFLQHANVAPGTVTGGFAATSAGNEDAIVVRLNGALTSAIYTHHGGANNDHAVAGRVHPLTGELYWAGRSGSADLQGRTNGAQGSIAGSTDGFVARASNDLSGGAVNPDIQAFYFINLPAVVAPGGGPYTGIGFACRDGGNAALFLADCQVTPSAGTIAYGTCSSPPAPLPTFTPGSPYPAVGPDSLGSILQAPAFQLACNLSYTAPGTAGGNDEATQQIALSLSASAVNDAVAGNNTLLSSSIDVLDAVDESATFPANAVGQTFLVASNDQLGLNTFGSNPLPPGVSYSLQPGSTCANASISAAGLATFDTPSSGTCQVNYQVCVGTVCDFASLTVTVTGSADMAITAASALPDVGPGQTVTGLGFTCGNIDALPATNATCNVSVSSGAVLNLSCTPTPPITVNPGDAIVCTFDFQAPGTQGGFDEPAQQITATYSTGALNDVNPGNNSTSRTASVLDALNDATSVPWTATAQSFNLAANDQYGLGGVPGTAVFTLLAASCPAASVSALGLATFNAPAVPPGTCTIDYRVCIGAGPIPCDVARLTVTATFPDMQANPPVPPPAAAPGGSEPVSFSCTNAGTDAALQATCSAQVIDCATLTPAGALSAVSCSPTVPVASLSAGNGINCTANYQAPGSVGGSAIGAGPNLCLVVTAGSNPADPLPANNVQQASFVLVDAVSESINVGSAGSFNVAANDFNGGPVPPGASYSLVSGPGTTCPSAAITPAGVASYGLPVGSCTITYRVCVSGRCDEAVLTITGLPPPRPIPALGVLGVAGLALGLGLLARRRLRA